MLRLPAVAGAMIEALDGIDRLVLLGDVLELRSGPQRQALATARPVLEALGAALGDRPVVLVPGNHDHALIAPWLDRRDEPLGLSHAVAAAEASVGAATLAGYLAPAPVEVRYPGLWLRNDVYATHGHYLDCHITVPSVERLAIGAMSRLGGAAATAADASSPDDYERLLAPIYAWINSVAQNERAGHAVNGGVSGRAWRSLRSSRRGSLRWRALGVAWPVAVAALNRAGIGPLRSELSGGELRRAGLLAMCAVVERLAIDAKHVVFGHTHRAGPLPRDRGDEWRCRAGGPALHNTGCWVYETTFMTRIEPENPYWPGTCVVVDDDGGPPRVQRLLSAAAAAELAGTVA